MIFILAHDGARERAIKAVREAPVGFRVQISEPKRSNDQNALMWALLTEVSAQVNWHGQRLSKEEWKDVLTASLKRQKVVPGIDGGFVVLGSSTSRMTRAEMTELIELIYAFGTQHGVEFSEIAA